MKRWLCVLLVLLCLAGCGQVPAQPAESGVPSPPATQAPTEPTATTAPSTQQPPTEPPAVRVTDFQQLQQAAQNLQAGDTLCIEGDFEVTEPVIFDRGIRLQLRGELLCSAPLCFVTDRRELIEIDIGEQVDISGLDIRLDAPNCQVLWPRQLLWETEAEQAAYWNVASLNGVDLRAQSGLGGTGTEKILSFRLESEGLSWTVEGNTLYLAVSYLTGDPVLEDAAVTVITQSGKTLEARLDLSPGVTRYTLEDGAGGSRTYQIVTTRITYELPVFYIEIEGDAEVTSREEYLNATVRVENAGALPGLDTTQVLIRGRGHFSWRFDKTPYKLRFEEKTSVLGMNASKNWVLLANYADRSLIQNHVAMEMGKVMTNLPYHSNQYPVDVFVNGTYRGVYTFGEQLEAKPERMDLEENYADPDTDYLLEVGGYDEGDMQGRDYFHAGTLLYVSVKHPESALLTQEQLDYLIGYVRTADEAVRSGGDYEAYIDVDSLIDWVILHELTYNLDCCFRRSCYLIKEKGGKLKMGPIWDFDLAFGSFYRYDADDWATAGEAGGYVGITWMNYLLEDPAFMARFAARWNEIKAPLLAAALNTVEEAGARVAPSAQYNFQVWDILGQSVSAQPDAHKQYDTYEKMLTRLADCIRERYAWLDSQLNP